MRGLVWRLVEWRLGRHLTPTQLLTTLGDLEEDVARRERAMGGVRASLWLLSESRSVAVAYQGAARAGAVHRTRSAIMPRTLDETRLAVRRLRKQPTVSLASIVTLACGIGAGAAAYSLISSVLLNPLPVERADRLVEVNTRYTVRSGATRLSTAHVYPVFTDVRDSRALSGVAAGGQDQRLVVEHGQAQQRTLYFASHNFFDVLGVRLLLGPGFSAAGDRRGAPVTAIASYRYWQQVFNGDPAVVGRTVTIAGVPVTVVGVAPPGFRGLSLAAAPDLYLPLHTVGAVSDPSSNYFADPVSEGLSSPWAWLTVIGRLKDETTAGEARARLSALPGFGGRSRTLILTPLDIAAIPETARPGMRRFAGMLSITVGLLLLIAALTVGMLLLIRTEARRDEFAMCLALGATRRRLGAGVAIEGALLSTAGATLALPIAWALVNGLGSFQLPGGVSIDLLELGLDARVFLAAAGSAVAVTLLIAGVAGVFGFTADIAPVLRARPGRAPTLTRRRTRSILVTVQVAVTLVLLAGAGLFARSLMAALQLNAGVEPHRLVTGSIGLTSYGYSVPRAEVFFDEFRERLGRNRLVTSVGMSAQQGGMSGGGQLIIDGQPRRFPSTVAYVAVDDRYFKTMGLPILAGRSFTTADRAASPLVVVVSESFGRMLANGGDPIGRRIRESSSRAGRPPATTEIIGVVPDVVTNVAVLEPLVIYYSLAQRPGYGARTFIARAAGDVMAVARDARDTIRAIDPVINPAATMTLQERIGQQMGPQRFGVLVLGVLGGIAVLLTILGAYVLAESMAAVRRREMGIRAALGANRATLGRLLLWQTTRLIGVGLIFGLGLAWLGASTIRAFLFQVQPFDPVTLIGVAATILVLALLVSLKPAVAATQFELARLLREQ
jgi:predicted permease